MQKGRCSEHIEGAELLHKGTASCESHEKLHVTDATVGSWHNRKQQSPICVDFPEFFLTVEPLVLHRDCTQLLPSSAFL